VNDDWIKMYSTVGIEDHSEEDGLVYSYANEYAPGAAPLSPGLAVKFTTEKPVFQAIELSHFAAYGSPAEGGGSGSGASGTGQVDSGILLSWELDDPRPLLHMELLRMPDGPEADWETEAVQIAGPLAPASGVLLDDRAALGTSFRYRMIAVDAYGKRRTIGETLSTATVSSPLMLRLPGGNLVTGELRLLFSTGRGELRDLAVFDASGRMVYDLLSTPPASPQIGEISWDGRDTRGKRVPGGVYWARLGTSTGERTARFVVIR
jgi:hypothetical protein